MTFETVCQLDDIIPGTGVCALVNGQQIALFRPRSDETVYAIDNQDPFAKANVLSRGLVAEHQGELWVASPLKKQRFSLTTGQCLEQSNLSLRTYAVQVTANRVAVSTQNS